MGDIGRCKAEHHLMRPLFGNGSHIILGPNDNEEDVSFLNASLVAFKSLPSTKADESDALNSGTFRRYQHERFVPLVRIDGEKQMCSFTHQRLKVAVGSEAVLPKDGRRTPCVFNGVFEIDRRIDFQSFRPGNQKTFDTRLSPVPAMIFRYRFFVGSGCGENLLSRRS